MTSAETILELKLLGPGFANTTTMVNDSVSTGCSPIRHDAQTDTESQSYDGAAIDHRHVATSTHSGASVNSRSWKIVPQIPITQLVAGMDRYLEKESYGREGDDRERMT